jgi:hypothetical protein
VYVFVSPFEVVDYTLVGQFLFHNEKVLEEFSDALVNVKMVELCNHGFLVLEILFVLVN